MKVAIISIGHYASTLPLAKYLSLEGCKVDYYLHCDHRVGVLESVNIRCNSIFGTHPLKYSDAEELYEYLKNERTRFFITSTRSIIRKYLPNCKLFLPNFFQRSLVRKLSRENYDVINIVGRYNLDILNDLIRLLPSNKLVVSLHEVVNHINPDYSHSSPILDYIFGNNIRVVVHSQNVYNSIVKYDLCDKKYVSKIPFGLFETYAKIKDDDSINLPSKYILFIGYINQYKGLDILYDAIQLTRLNGYKVVVAGNGYVPIIEKIKNDNRFIYIPGYLNNERFVALIKKSAFLVCPYTSMSQSGIPQTAFVFNKPIVASDLEGFREVLTDGVNGYFTPVNDSNTLAIVLSRLLNDSEIIEKLSNNISHIRFSSSNYKWENIAKQYLDLFRSVYTFKA